MAPLITDHVRLLISALPSQEKRADSSWCETTSLDWTLFALAVLILTVNWWLFRIPTLIEHGFAQFWNDLCWECLRITVPGSCALYALDHTDDAAEWPRLFYFGGKSKSHLSQTRFTVWNILGTLVSEVLIVLAALLAIVRISKTPPDEPHLFLGLWFYATLPQVVVGLCILAGSYFRWSRHSFFCFMTVVLILVGVSYGLAIHYASPNGENIDSKVGVVLFVLSMFPWSFMKCCSGFFHIFFILTASIVRIVGFCVSLHETSDQGLFCAIVPSAVTPAFIIVAILMWVFAFIADIRHYHWESPATSTTSEESRLEEQERQDAVPAMQQLPLRMIRPRPSSRLSEVSAPPAYEENAHLPSYEDSQQQQK